MTTQSWAFAINHTSDANFRLWGLDFAAKLAAVGLVQTADTGQINWTTVTRPGTNTAAGYEIWRFNDTQQGTAPIYMRIEYGTEGDATRPRIRITVGPSTDGAGAITGTAKSTVAQCGPSGSINGDGTSRQCYMCAVDGAFWWAWGASGASPVTFITFGAVFRSTDADGVPDALAAIVVTFDATQTGQHRTVNLRFASPATLFTANTGPTMGHVYFNEAATVVGGVPQVFPMCMWTPRLTPLFCAGIIKITDIAEIATFTWTPFGLTSHTYLNLGRGCGTHWTGISVNNYGFAFIWE